MRRRAHRFLGNLFGIWPLLLLVSNLGLVVHAHAVSPFLPLIRLSARRGPAFCKNGPLPDEALPRFSHVIGPLGGGSDLAVEGRLPGGHTITLTVHGGIAGLLGACIFVGHRGHMSSFQVPPEAVCVVVADGLIQGHCR